MGQYAISFFKNLPNTYVEDTKKEIEDFYEDLIERKYLPFARISDVGVLCFDVNKTDSTQDYPIVSLYDDDNYSNPKFYSENFESMFIEFEEHLDEWMKTKREQG